jgi:hypothetical protein
MLTLFNRWKLSRMMQKSNHFFEDFWPASVLSMERVQKGYLMTHQGLIRNSEVASHIISPQSFDLQTFEFLKLFKMMGENRFRRLARQFVQEWILQSSSLKSSFVHHPVVIAQRLSNWAGFFHFFGQSADDHFQKVFFQSFAHQYFFLRKKQPFLKDPIERLVVLKSLLSGSYGYPQLHKQFESFLRLFKQIWAQLDETTSPIRSTWEMVLLVKHLIELEMMLKQKNLIVPSWITQILQKKIPLIRFLRHGDGSLTNFVGLPSEPIYEICRLTLNENTIDMILSFSEVFSQPTLLGEAGGLVRSTHGINTLILNTQPSWHHLQYLTSSSSPILGGHGLGFAQFEWSRGKNRLIQLADCVVQGEDGMDFSIQWKKARSHFEQKEGYIKLDTEILGSVFRSSKMNFGLSRTLYWTPEHHLKGEDQIELPSAVIVAFRFVFDPLVKVSPHGPNSFLVTFSSQGEELVWWLQGNHFEELLYQQWQEYPVVLFLQTLPAYHSHRFEWRLLNQNRIS